MGIQNVIKMYGATTDHRNSNKYNFKATSEVSILIVMDIYTYIQMLGNLGVKISCLTFWLSHNTCCSLSCTEDK